MECPFLQVGTSRGTSTNCRDVFVLERMHPSPIVQCLGHDLSWCEISLQFDDSQVAGYINTKQVYILAKELRTCRPMTIRCGAITDIFFSRISSSRFSLSIGSCATDANGPSILQMPSSI